MQLQNASMYRSMALFTRNPTLCIQSLISSLQQSKFSPSTRFLRMLCFMQSSDETVIMVQLICQLSESSWLCQYPHIHSRNNDVAPVSNLFFPIRYIFDTFIRMNNGRRHLTLSNNPSDMKVAKRVHSCVPFLEQLR